MANSIFNLLIVSLVVFFTQANINAQTSTTFDKNILLPEETGGMGGDFIEANGKIFVYAQSKIYVYQHINDITNLTYITTIDLKPAQLTTNLQKEYGKYAPPYFNYNFHSPSGKMITMNTNESLIYTITPDLNIVSVSTDNNYDVTKLMECPQIISHFKITSGRVIIKYDELNQRLYTLFSGRDEINKRGSYHVTDSYFAIYEIGNNGNLTLKCEEFREGYDIANGGTGYTSTAIEIEPYRVANTDLFYVARKNKIELCMLTLGSLEYSPVNNFTIPEAKIGKMFSINNNTGLHKIVVLPYRLPFTDPEPALPYTANFYIFEAGSLTMQNQAIIAPSKRILDGCFIPEENTIVLTFPNHWENETDFYYNDENLEGMNLAFYTYISDSFAPDYTLSLKTNNNSLITKPYNFDYPLTLIPGNNGDFYLGSINQWTHITYNDVNEPFEYVSETVIDKKGSYFNFGLVEGNFNYPFSTSLNGIYEINNTNNTIVKKVKNGHSVYQSVYNPSNNYIYFYNTLSTDNSQIFVYNPNADNGNGELIETIEIGFPIGDIVYNPFTGHLLISSNSQDNNVIRKLNSDNDFEDDISLSGYSYTKQLFVSPNGLLCVLTNSQSTNPTIIIFDGSDYSSIKDVSIDNITLWDDYSSFNASFCYNPYNNMVYATIKNNYIIQAPYTSQKNTCEYTGLSGVLLSVNAEATVSVLESDLVNPGKIICPELLDPSSDFEGCLYFIGHTSSYTDNISYFDCETGIITSADFTPSVYLNDIEYNQHTNSILAFSDQTITTPETGEYTHDRKAVFYRIDKTSDDFDITELGSYDGQIAGFFNNPYNGKLYVQTKLDTDKNGTDPLYLIEYDPLTPTTDPEKFDLGITGYYTEYDHYDDALYGWYNYNLTTPYIDPYQNKMYIPNGAHSKVSVVEFDAEELLVLDNKEYDWISIPRLYQQSSTTPPSVNSVLMVNINPDDYLDESELQNYPPDGYDISISTYEYSNWPTPIPMEGIYSDRGYKIKLLYNESTQYKYLVMHGDVLESNTEIPLYSEKENWVGYFIYNEQDVFDALGEVLWYASTLQGEDWFCYYDGPSRNASNPVITSDGWICNNENHNVDYGDMIVIHGDYFPENYTFSWAEFGTRSPSTEEEDPENFDYTETADYDPIVVTFDSTENIEEIGVFVDDSCVGACVVEQGDTIAGIQAYTDGIEGDSITFQTWTSTKSTQKSSINVYSVLNPSTGRYETRTIHPRENQSVFKVSLKSGDLTETISEPLTNLAIYPNPSSNIINIFYSLSCESDVTISVFNGFGKHISILHNNWQKAGNYTQNWNLTVNGKKINKGIYIIKLTVDGETVNRKLVIQ